MLLDRLLTDRRHEPGKGGHYVDARDIQVHVASSRIHVSPMTLQQAVEIRRGGAGHPASRFTASTVCLAAKPKARRTRNPLFNVQRFATQNLALGGADILQDQCARGIDHRRCAARTFLDGGGFRRRQPVRPAASRPPSRSMTAAFAMPPNFQNECLDVALQPRSGLIGSIDRSIGCRDDRPLC